MDMKIKKLPICNLRMRAGLKIYLYLTDISGNAM